MSSGPAMIQVAVIRVVLPAPLRELANIPGEVHLKVEQPFTQARMIDALESGYPILAGTIRDRATQRRRPFIRFFAGERDLSHESPDAPLPEAVAAGREAVHVIAAMAGG